MMLRKKTLLIVCVTLAGVISFLYFVSRHAILTSFSNLEEQDVQQNLERGMSALSDELAGLERTAKDYANWDNTYAFVSGNNPTYEKTELSQASLLNLKLNCVVIRDLYGRPILSKSLDFFTGNIESNANVFERLAQELPGEGTTTGIVVLQQGILLVASKPILKSDGLGPTRGTLLIGRWLNEEQVAQLARSTHLALSVLPIEHAKIDFPSSAAPIVIRPLDAQSIVGYQRVQDFHGKPAFVLRVVMPRTIYQQGQTSLFYFVVMFLLTGILFGAAMLFSLDKTILSRLSTLSDTVTKIGLTGDLTARTSVSGGDEISSLGSAINRTLEALEKSQQQQEDKEKLLGGEKRLLEMIAKAQPLPDVLDFLARLIESQTNGPLCSVLLLGDDGKTLRHGAAPSLPATYTHAIDGTLIGPNVGSCGTAAYFGTPIVVADIATDPLWKDYKELALSHGLQACWSVPIISTKGIVLGTTAVYYPNPRTPSYEEMDLIERAAHVAGIAIERKRAEQTLVHNALHDSLTNLPNRALFLDRLQHEFTRAKRHDDYKFAVLFIDIDGFKTVNDSLGHAIGDDLIIEVGRRLTRFLRHDDIIARQESNADEDSLARLGGDEFTVLLEDIKDPSDAIRAAQRIQNALTAPHMLDGHEVYTSVSIGIALSSAAQNTAEDLLRDADIAMYRAKSLGKARCEVFDVTMHRHAVERLRLETDLRNALDRKEFCVHYQPIVSVDTRKLTGFEALVRWNRPQVGLVGPDKFIKVAEETGLIIAIDKWVLEEACRQMQIWHSLYAFASELTISVNLSPKQFTKPNLAQEIHAVVDSTKLSPSFLNLELTETIAMSDAEKTRTILSELKAVGARLSIDDFGTGYSSLSYLRRFPVDILKIDRSFVSNMNVDDNRKIVATMIALAHNLGLRVVAEGTETEEQFRQLQDLKCELAQGYLFSPPLSVQEATDFLLTRTVAKGAVSGSNSSSQI